MKHWQLIVPGVVAVFLIINLNPVRAANDCPTGYTWDRMSGVGCVQTNCHTETIPNAHYSYEGYCVCGSSGSMSENPTDPNKECALPADDSSCPNCIYACVHFDEECPNHAATANTNTASNNNGNASVNASTSQNTDSISNNNQSTNIQSSSTPSLMATLGAPVQPATCQSECNKYLRGHAYAVVVLANGVPPACQCQIDVRDSSGRLTQTISTDGPDETTLTYDPNTGDLIKKTRFNRQAEAERIRQRLGYRYTEAEIDALLTGDQLDAWFRDQMKNIKTSTSLIDPQFWWQHLVAVFDHGFDGNSADFVDTYQFGRCGDSMQWLERNLAEYLRLNDDPEKPGQKHEAFLSITGEKFSNTLNHTSLIIRPAGFTNDEWEGIVSELKTKSGGSEDNPGITAQQLNGIDPRLLDAKVLDPYKKKITTVREFIKGWSYIRIS